MASRKTSSACWLCPLAASHTGEHLAQLCLEREQHFELFQAPPSPKRPHFDASAQPERRQVRFQDQAVRAQRASRTLQLQQRLIFRGALLLAHSQYSTVANTGQARKGKDLYMWISKVPNGPTVKMHVQNRTKPSPHSHVAHILTRP